MYALVPCLPTGELPLIAAGRNLVGMGDARGADVLLVFRAAAFFLGVESFDQQVDLVELQRLTTIAGEFCLKLPRLDAFGLAGVIPVPAFVLVGLEQLAQLRIVVGSQAARIR